jgi:glycosyltransferase involved in cell wall biosynthesis
VRVALFSPVWFPVPPQRYGGIESVVKLLADGLVGAGLDVTLFASGESRTQARQISVFERSPANRIGETFWELQHALSFVERADDFDLVHDHSGLLGLTLFGLTRCPVIHTVHGPLTGEPGTVYARACGVLPRAGLVSLTLSQRRPLPHANWIANINNAIDLRHFPCNRKPEEFLLFLGRMSPDKGAHNAVTVARRSGRPLKIAAKCREPEEIAYFDQYVAPHLGDQVSYVGEVTHDERCELLSRAHALLVPIEWEEPFGLTIIEALASGTPVVAFRRGSVPELLEHGRTGFVVDDINGMVAALAHTSGLAADDLRGEAERRFSVDTMIQQHLVVYEGTTARSSATTRQTVPMGVARDAPSPTLT